MLSIFLAKRLAVTGPAHMPAPTELAFVDAIGGLVASSQIPGNAERLVGISMGQFVFATTPALMSFARHDMPSFT